MMNAYQRPLFRQAGGPAGIEALPPPPPAGVAAIPQQDPQAMVEAAGQMASSEMEAVGQDYVTEMMQSLDTAENFKTVIDALRGNKLPMNERFAELAEYVGEDDAEKTPESVLAMVQPVIMMTEEGNVDSGIGQLMQSLTGEVDMMTEEGDLTDMGQGVGSLMVANQEAPPQQFANGGAVQHFANGGGPFAFRSGSSYMSPGFQGAMQQFTPEMEYDPRALQTGYEQRLPMYMGILDPEKERQMTQSQIMFDIAQAGLNLAGGVDPRTGQSMTGLPVASQIATAAGGLPGQISSRLANQRQSEQAAKLAALQASEAETTATRAAVARERERAFAGLQAEALQSQALETDLFKTGLLHGNEQERMELAAEIEEMRQSHESQEGRVTQEARFDLQSKENRLLHKDRLGEMAEQATQDMRVFDNNENLRQTHRMIVQDDDQAWQSGENELNRELTTWIKEQEFEDQDQIIAIKEALMELDQDRFKDFQERGPATVLPFLKRISGGSFIWDTEARNAWQAQNQMTMQSNEFGLRQQDLMNQLAQYEVNNAGVMDAFQRSMAQANHSLQLRQINLAETELAYGVLLNHMMPAAREEYSRNQMYQLLADPNVINAYKAGVPMPDVELALSQVFKWTRDPETGEMTQSELPPGWEAAFRQREGLGFAVPNVGKRSLFFNADGGEIKKMQGGGDPRGAYEPITGTYLPFRDRREDEPVPIEDPLITATGQGIDITAATGSDAFVVDKLNSAVEAVTGLFGGPGMVMGPEYQEAIRALDSFNQIALTRALGSIAGRENRELQERLARLEVPAARLLYNDRKAYAQFQTSSRVMDFAIREQDAALRGPSLTRSERNKASKDLAALQGIKLEYDRLADAFGRKIEGDTSDVSSRLDQFFN